MSDHSGVRKAMWIGSGVLALGIVAFVVSIGLIMRHDPPQQQPSVAIAVTPPTHKTADHLLRQQARFQPRSIEDVLRISERSKPRHVADVSAAFDPLPSTGLDTVHALADAFLQRYVALYPQFAPDLGQHVHPTDSAAPTFERMVAEALLADHVLRRLDSGAIKIESDHDVTDAVWLRTLCVAARKPIVREWTVRWLLDAPVSLVFLTHYECCDAEIRARDSADLLDAIAAEATRLHLPPLAERRSLVELVRTRIDEHIEFVLGVSKHFEDVSATTRARLEASAHGCALAFEGVADRLPVDFAPAGRQRLGIGPHAYTTVLHGMGVTESPHQLFLDASQELYDASEAMNDAFEAGYDTDLPPDLVATDAPPHLAALVLSAKVLIAGEPSDPGVRLAPIPSGWPDAQAFLLAPLPGVDAPSVVFVGGLGGEPDLDATNRAFDGRALRHLLGHEAYPGHHVHHLHERAACRLRRLSPSPVGAEGWAVHASRLLREGGAAPDDTVDAWVRASERANYAFGAMVDIAVNCLGLSAAEIEEWELDFDAVGDPLVMVEWAEEFPGQLISYFLGPTQVAQLETKARDAGMDLREFRARLLGAGSLPARVLERELLR